jgi:hypothetical protein
MLPYTQNLDFVGRRDILERLKNNLAISDEHQPRAVLWGLGGVGSILHVPQAITATDGP